MQRQLRVGICCYVQHGEIIGDKRIAKTTEGDSDKDKLRLSGRSCNGNPITVAPGCAEQRQRRLSKRQQQRKDKCKLSNLRNHVSLQLMSYVRYALAFTYQLESWPPLLHRWLDRLAAACSFHRALLTPNLRKKLRPRPLFPARRS